MREEHYDIFESLYKQGNLILHEKWEISYWEQEEIEWIQVFNTHIIPS